MKNTKKLFSKMAQNVIPYQWETGVSKEMLRFDTNTLANPPPAVNSLIRQLENNCSINEYNDPSYSKLKQLIANYEGVTPENITITNSGDEALDVLAKTFLNPNDLFIIQPPTYEMFKLQCVINNGQAIEVPLNINDFSINKISLLKTIKEKPIKITFICNPNNPTGTVYSQELIVKIVKATSGIVLVDEAYREFYGKTAVPLINKFQNIVVLRSFSKFGGMAGARIGYLIASKDLSQIFDAIRFPLGVSMFSAQLAEILLKEDQSWIKKQITLVQKERERFIKELSSLGIYCFPSQSNFILARIGSNANNVCEELKKRNILVRNRSNKKYLEGCIRITIRNPEQNNILINNLKQIYD